MQELKQLQAAYLEMKQNMDYYVERYEKKWLMDDLMAYALNLLNIEEGVNKQQADTLNDIFDYRFKSKQWQKTAKQLKLQKRKTNVPPSYKAAIFHDNAAIKGNTPVPLFDLYLEVLEMIEKSLGDINTEARDAMQAVMKAYYDSHTLRDESELILKAAHDVDLPQVHFCLFQYNRIKPYPYKSSFISHIMRYVGTIAGREVVEEDIIKLNKIIGCDFTLKDMQDEINRDDQSQSFSEEVESILGVFFLSFSKNHPISENTGQEYICMYQTLGEVFAGEEGKDKVNQILEVAKAEVKRLVAIAFE